MSRPDIQPVLEFLKVDSPTGWINSVASNLDLLLIDHANCEKKAANSALSIIFRYVEYPDLIKRMSKLAREELRHFEQVIDLMQDLQSNTNLSAHRDMRRRSTKRSQKKNPIAW